MAGFRRRRPRVVLLRGADGALAECHVPFRPLDGDLAGHAGALFALETGPFLTVPDPRLAVLRETPARLRAVRVRLVEPK